MPFSFVRARRVATLAVIALSATAAGCSLGGDTSLPPYTDPATQTYAAVTNVAIANMTRVNSQLYTQDVTVGTGRTVAPGDSIRAYYAGRLTGGFRFDSLARPAAPLSAVLDTTNRVNGVIKGWVQGLAGMKAGGVRRLVIGPESAYRFGTRIDANGAILIPPNSVLVFDVEVVEAFARLQ
jgi:FKBP-type peptidyl-prolyl cis-trans isomerase FkpA